jgi:hypothetical protein
MKLRCRKGLIGSTKKIGQEKDEKNAETEDMAITWKNSRKSRKINVIINKPKIHETIREK